MQPIAHSGTRPAWWTRRRGIRAVTTALLLSTAASTACVRPNTGQTTPEEEEAILPVGPIALSVENRSTYNVTIYAVRGTLRRRLGEVASLSRAELTVPETFTNDHGGLSLLVLQIGGPLQYVSDNMAPQREQRMVLVVQPRITNSALSIEES